MGISEQLANLSGPDSKKYQAILRAKRKLAETSESVPVSIMSEKGGKSYREFDEFGEITARKLQPIIFMVDRLYNPRSDPIIIFNQRGAIRLIPQPLISEHPHRAQFFATI